LVSVETVPESSHTKSIVPNNNRANASTQTQQQQQQGCIFVAVTTQRTTITKACIFVNGNGDGNITVDHHCQWRKGPKYPVANNQPETLLRQRLPL
jgi:glutamate 5-kinase